MYAPSYGYGPGNGSQPFHPNGAQGQPQNTHQQQQQQQPGQQPQQMMYNPQAQVQQAYGAAAQSQPLPYGVPSPGMGGNAGGMGMMQNSGLTQMPGGQSQYQTPYTTSPYGTSIPTSSSSNLPQNFMPATSGAPNFQMNASQMNPQQNRMQPPPQSSTPNPRAPYGGVGQHTPPNAGPQPQFSTPQNVNQPHMQTPNNQQTQAMVSTPQTPNFPPGTQMSGNAAPPMSPESEAREKQRVTLLLDINIQLLLEASRIQAIQAAEKEKAGEVINPANMSLLAKAAANDYVACMRRLQANLAYLAAIADRSHKPSSQIPPHPAIMTAPTITSKSTSEQTSPPTKIEDKEKDEKLDITQYDKERVELLARHYTRLQELFPGVDISKGGAAIQKPGHTIVQPQQKSNPASAAGNAAGNPTQNTSQDPNASDLAHNQDQVSGPPAQVTPVQG